MKIEKFLHTLEIMWMHTNDKTFLVILIVENIVIFDSTYTPC